MAPWAKPWQKVCLVFAAGSPDFTPQVSASSPAVFVLIAAGFAACAMLHVNMVEIARMMTLFFMELFDAAYALSSHSLAPAGTHNPTRHLRT
jgi:hypothetical protein